MTSEVWVSIQGYEDTYEVSNLGRVRNIKKGHFLTPGKSSQSIYHRLIYLYKDNKVKGYSLSRLVGTHFLPMTGGYILHIEEDLPEDQVNSLSNLKVGTQSQNIKESYDKGRKVWGQKRGEDHPKSQLTEDQVREIKSIWKTPGHPTRDALGKRFQVGPDTIKNIVIGRTWKWVT